MTQSYQGLIQANLGSWISDPADIDWKVKEIPILKEISEFSSKIKICVIQMKISRCPIEHGNYSDNLLNISIMERGRGWWLVRLSTELKLKSTLLGFIVSTFLYSFSFCFNLITKLYNAIQNGSLKHKN